MIEMLVLAMILSGVTLKAAGNVAVDVAFAVRGKESPRYTRAKARPSKSPSAFRRYWSQLWADSWEQRLAKHNTKLAGGRPEKPRGAARVFWSGVGQDVRRAGLRKWDQGWMRLDEKRRSRSARVPDGTDVVPGEVVPEPPIPADPEPVPQDKPDSGTDPLGTDPFSGTGTCPKCGATVVGDDGLCSSCTYQMQQQRTQYRDEQDQERFEAQDRIDQSWGAKRTNGLCPRCQHEMYLGPDGICSVCQHEINTGQQANPTQEGTPTMTTMPTTEVVGLDQAISYCEASAVAHREQIIVIDNTMAALAAGDVTGPAAAQLGAAKDANTSAQAAMEGAAAELRKQKAIQEQYDAVQGAGTREFITNGR